ncbi:hypothetical protein ACOME3_003227 [Neoechinorhynchus agilis]
MCDPEQHIKRLIEEHGFEIDDPRVAEVLDDQNKDVNEFRKRFLVPHVRDLPVEIELPPEQEIVYFSGQSLGLQPREVMENIRDELNKWATMGALAHSVPSEPFNACDKVPIPLMASMVGALESEVVLMNTLTANLHIMLEFFYEPKEEKNKIIYEEHIFPSDKYAIDSVCRNHGLDPNNVCLCVNTSQPLKSILEFIDHHGHETALILIGNVQFYTGANVDIREITECGHRHDAIVGFDLAHANRLFLGNVALNLHEDDVDFAVWCTYKYLSGGPSSAGGMFIHERHFNREGNRLDGWWGATMNSRFDTKPAIEREYGAAGFRMSHPCPFQTKPLHTSLKIFEEAGFEKLYSKGRLMSQYLLMLLEKNVKGVEIITPLDSKLRGAQISFRPPEPFGVAEIKSELYRRAIIVDGRGDVVRVAPVHVYNTFEEVFRFVKALKDITNC